MPNQTNLTLDDNVLLVGHSLQSARQPQMLEDIIEDWGGSGTSQSQIINGAPLRFQWDNGDNAQVNARDALATGTIDALILAEAIPLHSHVRFNDPGLYASNYYNLAIQNNPDTQVYVIELWHSYWSGTDQATDIPFRSGGDLDLIPFIDRIEQDLPVWEGIADEVNAQRPNGAPEVLVIPAGQALRELYLEIEAGNTSQFGITDIEQLFGDYVHVNDVGHYFVAMVQYATIYGEHPGQIAAQLQNRFGADYDAPSEAFADYLQDLAWDVVTSYPRSGVVDDGANTGGGDPVNADPNAVNDDETVEEGDVLNGNVLANDTDPDGDALTAAVVTSARDGDLTLNANGTFSYRPDDGFTGTDTFVYRASDGNGGTDTATVSIEVTAAPDDGGTGGGGNPGGGNTGGENVITAGAARETHEAEDGIDRIVFTPGTSQRGAVDRIKNLEPGDIIDLNAFGFTSIGAPGSGFSDTNLIVGQPNSAGHVTVWSRDFSLIVENVNRATVLDAIEIGGSTPPASGNTAPQAVNDSRMVEAGDVLNGNVLANDTDADGDTLTATVVTSAGDGALTLNANGTFSYAPDSGFTGTDTFVYRASDGNGGTDTATVSIEVTAASSGGTGGGGNVINATPAQEIHQGTSDDDLFVFDLGDSSRNDGDIDRIRDFQAGDEIDVSAYGFETTGVSGFSATNLIVKQVNANVGIWNVRQDFQVWVDNADREDVDNAILLG